MPSTPEPSLEAPADPLPAPAASGDGAEAEPDEGSEPAEVTESIPAPEDFVRVADWIPDIYTDLRYAADNNFTGQAIYDFSDAYLRYGTVQKLVAAQETIAESGCSLLIWDAFRPASAQFRVNAGDIINHGNKIRGGWFRDGGRFRFRQRFRFCRRFRGVGNSRRFRRERRRYRLCGGAATGKQKCCHQRGKQVTAQISTAFP